MPAGGLSIRPALIAPADYWRPGPDEMAELDAGDTIRTRERWWANLEAEEEGWEADDPRKGELLLCMESSTFS